jgi:hypothetical protein
MPEKGWQRRFDDPIPLPNGRELVTLRDAVHGSPKPEARRDCEICPRLGEA